MVEEARRCRSHSRKVVFAKVVDDATTTKVLGMMEDALRGGERCSAHPMQVEAVEEVVCHDGG